MLGFWEALEGAAATSLAPSDLQPRTRDDEARADAQAFHGQMLRDRHRLSGLGIETTLLDGTVSFRRNGYGILSVHFGAGGGDKNRIVSAIAAHLKLEPSYEDVSSAEDIGPAAGRWLGLSMDLIAKHPTAFSRFGLT